MEGRKNTPPRAARSKSPAERAEEFAATQRRLKDEATARREAGGRPAKKRKT